VDTGKSLPNTSTQKMDISAPIEQPDPLILAPTQVLLAEGVYYISKTKDLNLLHFIAFQIMR
jgi:hypothetical protein